jgi:hypothetical protein
VVLYGRENCSLALGNRLRVSENRVLRMLEPERDEIVGRCREVQNEELHNLYSSPYIIRMFKPHFTPQKHYFSASGTYFC